MFLPSSLSCVSPPLRGLFLSFSQVEFSLFLSPISPDGFVPLAHISSPSPYSRLVLSSSFHRIYLTFVHSFPLAPFLLTLLSSLFPSLSFSFSRIRTYIHTHVFIRTRTCQPRLGSTKYARVSPRATLVMPRACALRVYVHIYARAATRHGRIYTCVNAATWTRDGQTPEIFSDSNVAVS